MSDVTSHGLAAVTTELSTAHDHVWRLVDLDFEYGGVGEYRCDSCSATWFS